MCSVFIIANLHRPNLTRTHSSTVHILHTGRLQRLTSAVLLLLLYAGLLFLPSFYILPHFTSFCNILIHTTHTHTHTHAAMLPHMPYVINHFL